MAYLTLTIEGTPDDTRREAIDEIARRARGHAHWRINPAIGRSYVLLELPDVNQSKAIGLAPGEVAYETAVIALAVSPTVPQALPGLLEALNGPGRPAGILACREFSGGVILEWNPNVSSVELVLGLVDVELRRFASGRTTELLAPIPPQLVAKIAAEGLQAPQIALERVLELLIDDA